MIPKSKRLQLLSISILLPSRKIVPTTVQYCAMHECFVSRILLISSSYSSSFRSITLKPDSAKSMKWWSTSFSPRTCIRAWRLLLNAGRVLPFIASVSSSIVVG